jgi:hypothetical protein
VPSVKLAQKGNEHYAVGPLGAERINIEDRPNPGESQSDYEQRVAAECWRAVQMVSDPSFRATAAAFESIDEQFGLKAQREQPMFTFEGNRMYMHPVTGRGMHNA